MDVVRWERRPDLRRPLLVVAFEGWNDAGDAASLAVSYLARGWGAKRFARIDAEEFFDFTATRPTVHIDGGHTRSIEWPSIELLAATVPGTGRDVVFLRGVEPQLKWRSFCQSILAVATTLRTEMALFLGALLADVPHTRPVRVSGTTDDGELADRLGLLVSSYEGPTGIVGVLHDTLTKGGLPAASFWAAVPHYVHQVPSPKAALALVERSASLLGARVNPLELRVAAEEYERQVSERVADDEDAAAYVAALEEADDTETASGGDVWPASAAGKAGSAGVTPVDADHLAAEVERYLRGHRGDS